MKQRNTGLHVGKYRKNRTFSSRLTETILPSALIFCALAGLLTTATGLTAILSLFASGLIFLALFTTVKHFRKEAILLPAALGDTYCNSNFCASNAPERLRRALE